MPSSATRPRRREAGALAEAADGRKPVPFVHGEDALRPDLGVARRPRGPSEPPLLYIDLHLVHEVTSAQAFEGLRLAGRRVRRPDLTLATMDHNVPTDAGPVRDPLAKAQLDALRRNCAEFGVPLYATGSGREGIVHVIGPELGLTSRA